MGIRFVFGRAGAGKSYYCLNQIKKKLNKEKKRELRLKKQEELENKKILILGYAVLTALRISNTKAKL